MVAMETVFILALVVGIAAVIVKVVSAYQESVNEAWKRAASIFAKRTKPIRGMKSG